MQCSGVECSAPTRDRSYDFFLVARSTDRGAKLSGLLMGTSSRGPRSTRMRPRSVGQNIAEREQQIDSTIRLAVLTQTVRSE